MKKLITSIAVLFASVCAFAQAEVLTYFDESSSVQVDGFKWNVVCVTLTDTLTFVQIGIIPDRVLSRLEYYTNPAAVITAGGLELTCIGALDRQSDLTKWHDSVRGRAYGWGNAEPGTLYSYTLVFRGRVPAGLKDITISNVRAGGYAFSFSTKGDLENPDPCENITISEADVRELIPADKYGLVGVYEKEDGSFKVGVVRHGACFRLVCLSASEATPWWHAGDVIGDTASTLKMRGEDIVGQATVFDINKKKTDVEVVFGKAGIKVGKEEYIKK